jgi:acyl transferase domain-containing protein
VTSGPGHDLDATVQWLCAIVARTVGARAAVDPDAPFVTLGVTSLQAIELAGAVRAELTGVTVAPTALYSHSTVRRLAAHLLDGRSRSAPAPDREPAGVAHGEPVAVVGIGCRLPGEVAGPAAFWRLLVAGGDVVTTVPADRWPVPATGDIPSRHGGFVAGIDTFDADFFGISPREAAGIDPQQRLLVITAWAALEDAGLRPSTLRGTDAGVFVGVTTSDYEVVRMRDPTTLDAHAYTGVNHSIAANRISYLLDLRGPSMTVDTACSSSLVAVHTACASLRRGECSAAIVGGVNALLSPTVSECFTTAGVLSPTGRSRAFSADADGYVRAEGATVVILKPLARARADGDRVYAVILGSAVNSDGRTNGLMAPNGAAQEQVYRAACRAAGIKPAEVSYVEGHGTGTKVGDLIELTALGAVYGAGRDVPCRVGSVKSNLGHLEAAAGVTGLAKVALALHHRVLPASLHVTTPHPDVDWDSCGLAVQTVTEPWPPERPLRAAVSSFGFGGTNAHVVLEACATAPAMPADPGNGRAAVDGRLLVVTAHTATALRRLARAWHDLLLDGRVDVYAACRAAAMRRDHHRHRVALPARDRGELLDALAALADGAELPQPVGVPAPAPAFLFPGALDPAVPVPVGDVFTRCDEILQALVDFSPVAALARARSWVALELPQERFATLVSIQIALAAQWRDWGAAPPSVLGRGVGEVAAAYVAGVLTLREALWVAWHLGLITETGDAAVARWLEVCGDLEPNVAELPLYGPTGEILDGRRLGARYWAGLDGSAPEPPDGEPAGVLRMDLPRGGLLAELGRRFQGGMPVDWSTVFRTVASYRSLPDYPFDLKRHPLVGMGSAPDVVDVAPAGRAAVTRSPRRLSSPALRAQEVWEVDLPATDPPGVGWWLAAIAGLPHADEGTRLTGVEIGRPTADDTTAQIIVADGSRSVYTRSSHDDHWTRRAHAATVDGPPSGSVAPRQLVAHLRAHDAGGDGPTAPFRQVWSGGGNGAQRSVVGFHHLNGSARLPDLGDGADPASFIACLDLAGSVAPLAGAGIRADRVSWLPGRPAVWFTADLLADPDGRTAVRLRAFDLAGDLRLAVDGLRPAR